MRAAALLEAVRFSQFPLVDSSLPSEVPPLPSSLAAQPGTNSHRTSLFQVFAAFPAPFGPEFHYVPMPNVPQNLNLCCKGVNRLFVSLRFPQLLNCNQLPVWHFCSVNHTREAFPYDVFVFQAIQDVVNTKIELLKGDKITRIHVAATAKATEVRTTMTKTMVWADFKPLLPFRCEEQESPSMDSQSLGFSRKELGVRVLKNGVTGIGPEKLFKKVIVKDKLVQVTEITKTPRDLASEAVPAEIKLL
nr:hypothetical protein Iba_chr14cCG10000 [Ipomoea batatas]